MPRCDAWKLIRRFGVGALAAVPLRALASGPELLPALQTPQDPSQFIQRENTLRRAINNNFLLRDGSNGLLPAMRNSICPIREVAIGTTDAATSADCQIIWGSSSASTKAQSIPACSEDYSLMIVDGVRTAAQYNITITPAGGTIGGAATAVIYTDGAGIQLICDSAHTNWILAQ